MVGVHLSSRYVNGPLGQLVQSTFTDRDPAGGVVSATITLGKELDSTFFSVLGEILSVLIILVWLAVMLTTVHSAWTGNFFPASGQMEVRSKPVEKVRTQYFPI